VAGTAETFLTTTSHRPNSTSATVQNNAVSARSYPGGTSLRTRRRTHRAPSAPAARRFQRHEGLELPVVRTDTPAAVSVHIGLWIFPLRRRRSGRSRVMPFGKSRAKRMLVDSPRDHVPRCRRRRLLGRRELHDIKEFPRTRRSSRRWACGSGRACCFAGHRAPARPCSRALSPASAVLHDLRVGLRRDVCRRWRLTRARRALRPEE
jgi:hypothetical protein